MATPPVFPPRTEARAKLDEELARLGLPPALSFPVEKQKRPGTQRLDWWHENAPESESADTLRSLAYLRAYVWMTGNRPLPAGGLRLRKDRLWMDRSVVSRLARDGFLALESSGHFEPSFVVTGKGRHWIATGEVLT